MLRVLSDETRLRIVEELQGGESNVTSLVKKLKIAQPTVSHHLAIMRMAGIVSAKRCGKEVRYTLQAQQLATEKAVASLLSGGAGLRIGNIVIGLAK